MSALTPDELSRWQRRVAAWCYTRQYWTAGYALQRNGWRNGLWWFSHSLVARSGVGHPIRTMRVALGRPWNRWLRHASEWWGDVNMKLQAQTYHQCDWWGMRLQYALVRWGQRWQSQFHITVP